MILLVVLLTVVTIVFKGIGPAVLGGREFPWRVQGVLDAFPAAVIAGLIAVQLLGERWANADWTVVPGLALAVTGWFFRVPLLACVLIAVLATIGVRLVV